MRKIGLLFIFLMLFVSLPSYGQQWAITYGGSKLDCNFSILVTPDGKYVVAGKTYSFGAGKDDIWVLKLENDGAVVWEKSYGGMDPDSLSSSIEQTSDGGYIMAGVTISFGAGWQDYWVLKLNADGSVAWQKTYGFDGSSEIPYSIKQTSDGGYILAGQIAFEPGVSDLWILKLDSNGNIEWENKYAGGDEGSNAYIDQTSDGGYIVASRTSFLGSGLGDILILKLNAFGAITWQKTYGGTELDSPESIQQTSDGGYIVSAGTKSFGLNSFAVWIFKLNSDGSVAWQKTYDGIDFNDGSNCIRQTTDGGYVIAGLTRSFGAGDWDYWILKLDNNGAILWEKTYGGSQWDVAESIRQTSDGGYVVAGYTYSFGAGIADLWVLKLDENGEIPGCEYMDTSNLIVADTSVTGKDTNIPVQNTTATAITTHVSPIDTFSETSNVCIEPCEGDLDLDGNVDGSDLAVFAADFGRTDCCEPDAPPCEGDFDCECDVDGSDLAVFAADFGRTGCPIDQ